MRRFLTVMAALLVVLLASYVSAQTTLSGDARIRPRLDIRDYGDFTDATHVNRTDGYYYYRARLNIKSQLGDGWFGHVQLGTNGLAYWTNKFGEGAVPGSSSIDGAGRGGVDFMLIYFGRKTDDFGYYGGLMPFNGLTNPLLDLHYYSHVMIDVPYFLWSNNGAHGFGGYIKASDNVTINAHLIVDNNSGIKIDAVDGTDSIDTKDQYTLMVDAPIRAGDFTIQPVLFFTAIAQDSTDKPMTYGANITTPKVGNWTFYGTYGMSKQSENGSAEYDAWFARLKGVGKIGKGTMTAWVDFANKEFDATDAKRKFTFFWIDYKIPVYSSDKGSLSIKPTWRHIAEKREDGDGNDTYDYTREKIEITIDYIFK